MNDCVSGSQNVYNILRKVFTQGDCYERSKNWAIFT